MSFHTHYFIAICYLICVLGCTPKTESAHDEVTPPEAELPDDFIDFYKRFNQDSMYQIAHIVFPLPGVVQDASGRDSSMIWLAKNWIHHKAVIPDELWSVDFTIPVDGVVIEFIHAKEGGYWMERRFAKMQEEWNLIYYAGLREPLSEGDPSTPAEAHH